MEAFQVRIKGTRPLLQHSPLGLIKARERGSGIPEPADEAKAGLYRTTEGTIYQPAQHLLSALRKVGGDYKVPGRGRKTFQGYIFSGLAVQPFQIPLLGGENGAAPTYEVDIQPAVIGRARIMRARPRFDSWALEFRLEILDPIVTPEIARQLLADAGKYQGLGDYRPLYGLFTVEQWEAVPD